MVMHFARRLAVGAGALAAFAPSGFRTEAATGGEPPAMVIVTASDAEEPMPLAHGLSGLIVRDTEPAGPMALAADLAPELQASTRQARGSLSVVAGGAAPAPTAIIASDSAVMPAASVEAVEGLRGPVFNSWLDTSSRQAPQRAGKSMVQRIGRYPATHVPMHTSSAAPNPARSAPGAAEIAIKSAPEADAVQAVHRERVTAPAQSRPNKPQPKARQNNARQNKRQSIQQSRPKQQTKANARPKATAQRGQNPAAPASPVNLLVKAHQLSLSANTQGQLSQIVKWCAQALVVGGLDNESKNFADQLSAWALNRRGQIRADEGQPDLALADFQAALVFDPTYWRALHNRGVTLAQSGQFAQAFDDLCKVIDLNPEFAKAYSNRATLYVQAGDADKALVDYDDALRLEPKLLPALVGRGRVRHTQGRLAEAAADLTAASELSPGNAEIVCSRADLLADLGRYNEALQDYARAIDLNPKFEHAYRNGAWLLATCPVDGVRDADGALAGAQAALDCGYGERYAALDTMAAALANAGRFEEAVGTMQQALEIAPEGLKAAYSARQQLYETGQPFRTRAAAQVAAAEFVEKK